MKKAELLSPAGNFEKLKIALAYGADAVYGGVSHFSLRIRSGKEFTYESFKEAIDYTHAQNKKIYVTVNGFPFNNQIKLLGEHLAQMADMKPDAFIISTPGVIKLSKQIAPQIPIHLSTQANVLNYLDAEVYADMGVERIIAAREVSLKDLVKIKEHLPHLELEIFVHGSMCFAYSGRCLISSVQSGRVPNRGSCANDCRFDYTLYAENPETKTLFKIEQDEAGTHIMNAKDMNMSAHVEEILKSGVIDSLKIEGRTKSPYYAAVTARTYRMAIDDFYAGCYDAKKYEEELNTTKNRGFSDAYLVSRPYERDDTQNLETAMSEGSYEVSGLVGEDGKHFMCKFTTLTHTPIEMITPMNVPVAEVENELGKIYTHEGKNYIIFYKIVTETDKELQSVHSGYTIPIKLPGSLAPFTIMRQKI